MRSFPRFKDDQAEIEKAEFHLQTRWTPILIGYVLLVLGVSLLWLSPSARAAVNCAPLLGKIQYSALFQIKNPDNPLSEPMRLIIGVPSSGMPKSSVNSPITAQIWSGTSCLATCQPGTFEKEGAVNPVSLDMDCKSARLTSFSTHATLLWGRGRSQSKLPTLRLGNWMEGYEQAALSVETDRFSLPAVLASGR